jgi:hypothetical protein
VATPKRLFVLSPPGDVLVEERTASSLCVVVAVPLFGSPPPGELSLSNHGMFQQNIY